MIVRRGFKQPPTYHQDRLREAELTGQFYPGSDDVTYTISFDRYDTTADITLP